MTGKRVQFDEETWQALDMLARDRMMSFQEVADEAFTDLLRKHGRPVGLKDALKRSVKEWAQPATTNRAARPAQPASMPGYIAPCDPVLRKVPPTGDAWLYEIKWDGYRAQLHIRPGKIIVY